jgi:hypothetical protein
MTNLMGHNINTLKKNTTDGLIDTTKKDALEGNTKITKYKLMSCHQNSGQNHNIEISNRPYENVTKYKFLGTTV